MEKVVEYYESFFRALDRVFQMPWPIYLSSPSKGRNKDAKGKKFGYSFNFIFRQFDFLNNDWN